MIIAISLILTLNIFKSRQPLPYLVLRFESIIKKPIATNYEFFTFITVSRIKFFPYINFIVIIQIYKIYLLKASLHQFLKDFHQNKLSFASLQFYNHCFLICLQVIFSQVYKCKFNIINCKRFTLCIIFWHI